MRKIWRDIPLFLINSNRVSSYGDGHASDLIIHFILNSKS
jgi:hypothetical protein